MGCGVRAEASGGTSLRTRTCSVELQFEGARGGMYAVKGRAFKKQVDMVLSGKRGSIGDVLLDRRSIQSVTCPACSDAGEVERTSDLL